MSLYEIAIFGILTNIFLQVIFAFFGAFLYVKEGFIRDIDYSITDTLIEKTEEYRKKATFKENLEDIAPILMPFAYILYLYSFFQALIANKYSIIDTQIADIEYKLEKIASYEKD